MNDNMYTLLVCTVGGSPAPIVATLKRWNPVRIRFVPTRETRDQIETRVLPLAQSEGPALDPGRYDVLELPAPASLSPGNSASLGTSCGKRFADESRLEYSPLGRAAAFHEHQRGIRSGNRSPVKRVS